MDRLAGNGVINANRFGMNQLVAMNVRKADIMIMAEVGITICSHARN